MVTEGAIDMISAVALGSERTIIALPGCENFETSWFEQFRGQHILLALDADGPGQMASARLKDELMDAGFDRISSYIPPHGCKDLNEQLVQSL
jgi:DNA primase